MSDFGNRPDGTPKGNGWFGVLKRPDGGVSTELSADSTISIDGKERQVLYPLLVPSLSKEEVTSLLSGDKPTDAIYRKAEQFAAERVAAGLSPFAGPDDKPQPLRTQQEWRAIEEQALREGYQR